jgi:hypothetical protein
VKSRKDWVRSKGTGAHLKAPGSPYRGLHGRATNV